MNLSQLMLEARRRSDMVNSPFIQDDELISYINMSAFELYDLLTSEFEYYNSTAIQYLLQSGSTIPLPVDYYKLHGLDLQMTGIWATLHQFQMSERNRYQYAGLYNWRGHTAFRYHVLGNTIELRPIQSAAPNTFQIWYAPRMQPLVLGTDASASLADITYTAQTTGTAGNNISVSYIGGGTAGSETVAVSGNVITVTIQNGVSTAAQVYVAVTANNSVMTLVLPTLTGTSSNVQSATPAVLLQGGTDDSILDGVSGWEEYVIIDAAIKMLVKEESDVSALARAKQAMIERVKMMAANRDASEPPTVSRTRRGGYGYNRTGGSGWDTEGEYF